MTGRTYRKILLTAMVSWATVFCSTGLRAAEGDNVVNDVFLQGQYYIWNRIADLLEIVRCGVAVGPAIGVEVAVTEYAQLGAYASKEAGVSFPHFIPPLWIVPHLEEQTILIKHKGDYATCSYGPRRKETSEQRDIRFERKPLEVRAQAGLALAHAYVSVDLVEIADFILGFFFFDLKKDDVEPFAENARQPGRQLARGLVNVVSGPLEIPFSVHLANKEEGDVQAVTYGLFRGIWRFVARELVGVMEIVTFPLGYEPVIEPMFPFKPERFTDWRVTPPSFLRRTGK